MCEENYYCKGELIFLSIITCIVLILCFIILKYQVYNVMIKTDKDYALEVKEANKNE